MDPDVDLEALLDAVWQRRRPELLDRLAALQQAVAVADDDPTARERGRQEAHRLTGSLGTLGFPTLSERVVRVERALRDGRPAAPLVAEVRAVEEAVRASAQRPSR